MAGNIKNNLNVILLICTLTVVVLLISKARSHIKNKTITVLFDSVANLTTHSPVTMKGLTVGTIEDLKLFNNKIAVDILLSRNINIPVNSKCRLQQPILGPATIAIEPGDQTTYITATDTLAGYVINEKLFDKLLADSAMRNKIVQALDTIKTAITTRNRLPADTSGH